MKSVHILWRVYLFEAHTGCVQYPRLRSLRSLSLGLLLSVPLRGTTAGHEREALSVLREAIFTVLDVECWVLGGILCCVMLLRDIGVWVLSDWCD